MGNDTKVCLGTTWRWPVLLVISAGMLSATGQNEEENKMRYLFGHKLMCMCIQCQNARAHDREKQERELEEQLKNQPPPKGRYIKKGAFATYEPTGVRERNDAALRRLGVISWSYYVKDTAFSPRVIAEFKFADGRLLQYNKKCKVPKEPVDIVQEWLMENYGAHGVAEIGISPSKYRSKQAFIEDYVAYRFQTASESEKRKYKGRIEGWEKTFRRALVQEADKVWRASR